LGPHGHPSEISGYDKAKVKVLAVDKEKEKTLGTKQTQINPDEVENNTIGTKVRGSVVNITNTGVHRSKAASRTRTSPRCLTANYHPDSPLGQKSVVVLESTRTRGNPGIKQTEMNLDWVAEKYPPTVVTGQVRTHQLRGLYRIEEGIDGLLHAPI
jgi:ribosomal protein S1